MHRSAIPGERVRILVHLPGESHLESIEDLVKY